MKFLFGDKVKVVGGFYRGIEGIVIDVSPDGKSSYYFEGYVDYETAYAREIKTWINEAELEKMEK
jgi:ribosomal protein L24